MEEKVMVSGVNLMRHLTHYKYIDELNAIPFEQLDFTALFGKDLTDQQKLAIECFCRPEDTNFDILSRIVLNEDFRKQFGLEFTNVFTQLVEAFHINKTYPEGAICQK